MAVTNTRDIRKELQQRYRNKSREASGVLHAYEDQGGAPRDTQGDAEGPWVKAPPFTENPQRWIEPTLLSSVAYTTLPGVETKQFRRFALYLTYTIPAFGNPAPPEGVGQLGLIPEARCLDAATGQIAWYTMATVDLTITAVTPPAAPFNALTLGVGSQDFLPTQLRWPPAVIGPVGAETTLRTRLLFDVSDVEAFRINVIELNAASDAENTFAAMYARSQ